MKLISISLIILSVLTILVNSINIDIDILMPDKNNKNHNFYNDLIHDPSRTFISLYKISDIINNQSIEFINNYHYDGNGIFHIELPTENCKYFINFQSLDLLFLISSEFIIDIGNNSNDNKTIQQFLPGIHQSLERNLPKQTFNKTLLLNGEIFKIGLKQFESLDSNQAQGLIRTLENSIPFLSVILNNTWLKYLTITLVIVGVLPFFLIKLDTEFADNLVKNQIESAKSTREASIGAAKTSTT